MNVLTLMATVLLLAPAPQDATNAVSQIVGKIQRADFEADRPALKRLHDELTPFVARPELASRVRYWQGFALARRAINGFNDAADRHELETDLKQCIADFQDAAARDPVFVDARAGAAGCLANLSFLYAKVDGRISERSRALYDQMSQMMEDALKAAPDNPRVLWTHGANQWYMTPERGGGQEASLATYERGLTLARQARDRQVSPLEPTWGEAELLMNLAFANLNRRAPDLAAAEAYGRAALALVPSWHYVRDILMVQIQKAKLRK